jgi:hypothetical protein
MAQLISLLNLMVSTSQLTIILIVVAGIFLIFIVVAVIKTYKLNAENKRLTELDNLKSEEDTSYKDFTDGHLYDNK